MKVLLLGPNGQLGHDVRREFAAHAAQAELLLFDRARCDVTAKYEFAAALKEINFEVLINCVGYNRTDQAEEQVDEAFAVNAHAVRIMAEICALKKARLVHISTDYVYGIDGQRTVPLREPDPIGPINVYGASKALGESFASLCCPNVTILRCASLFGIVGSSGKGGNFVETVIRLSRERRHIKVVDDQIMSPTSSADLARTIRLGVMQEWFEAGIYHAVNSGQATWYQFACEIIARAGIDADIVPCEHTDYPLPAMRPRFSALDNHKLSSLVGEIRHWRDALVAYLSERKVR